jgi:hypothetical protein
VTGWLREILREVPRTAAMLALAVALVVLVEECRGPEPDRVVIVPPAPPRPAPAPTAPPCLEGPRAGMYAAGVHVVAGALYACGFAEVGRAEQVRCVLLVACPDTVLP